MKKRLLLIGGLTVLGVMASAVAFAACDSTVPEENVPEITETVRYSEKTNPYAELTWQEYQDVDDWADKQENAPIYYQFEGSYSEAYQGDYSRTFLYMNCYEDGSLHATYGNNNYYGFWTNIDKKGKENLILHIVRYNNGEYNDGIYESVCDVKANDYYEYASTVVWNAGWGIRTVLINGYHYSPIKSITVDNAPDKYILGDQFSTSGLVVTVNRENGKSIAIDEDSFGKSDCRVQFTGFDSSEKGDKEITVNYIYTDIKTSYTVNVMGIKDIALDTKEAVKTFYVGDSLDTTGLVVTAERDDGITIEVANSRCQFTGFDASGVFENQTITVAFQGYEKTYDIKVDAAVYEGKVGDNDVSIKITTSTDCEYSDGSKTLNLNYKTMRLGGSTIYNISLPEDSTVDEATWASLRKQYVLDRDKFTLSTATVYEIPSDHRRAEQEPMPGIGGNTEQRFILLDEENGEATITYKYWYASNTDTFVCKYEVENGVLTFTELVRVDALGGGGANFDKLYKTWNLNEDFSATKYTPPEAE